jgi:DNA-binding response OmpR family regulator
MIRTVQKRTVLALLVEVNGLVRLKLTRALEQEDFEVLWVATTQEAVAAYNRRHIDLLLLDLNQPLKVGWDIFEPVGALNPALPIVMITEGKTELEPTVAERVGTRLEKPFSLLALIQTFNLLLGQPTQTHRQVTGSAPISNHLSPSGRTSSQPAPRWRIRQEIARKQTYETESAAGGRRQRVLPA